MAVNISGLRRNIKNVAHNYTDAQVKVREATSNDPWGPSSTMMSEIADLTYNMVAFTEIMQMVWKRLNDHGKNWRHVYKALVLLEYLIKTGSEKVAQQCKENIYAIQTLKDFQYLDDNKDQGINVREKAKALVALLKDDERLRNERVRALKAKERFAQSAAGIGSDTVQNPEESFLQYNASRERFDAGAPSRTRASPVDCNSELEAARPQTAGEEELQLQLALAMSREEAEVDENKSKSDDMRLQLALQKSKEEGGTKVSETDGNNGVRISTTSSKSNSSKNDLLDLDFGNPIAQPPPPTRTAASSSMDPWGMPVQQQEAAAKQPQLDPWGGVASAAPTSAAGNGINDPWSPAKEPPRASPNLAAAGPSPNLGGPSPVNQPKPVANNDPWSPMPSIAGGPGQASSQSDAWSPITGGHATTSNNEAASIDPFSPVAQKELSEFDLLRNEIESTKISNIGGTTSPNPFDMSGLSPNLMSTTSASNTGTKPKKSVHSLLGEHSNLVNLDNLVTADNKKNSTQATRNPFEQHPPNPFQAAAKNQKPAMNELLQQQTSPWQAQQPQQPQQQNQQNNQGDFNPFF